MRCVRDAALLRATTEHAETANNLKQKPEPNRHERGYLCHEPGENNGYPVCGKQQNVTTQHTRDCARGAETRNHQTCRIATGKRRRGKDMRKSGEYAADQIKNQVSNMTQPVLDIVAEDEKKKHVAEDVRDPAVHEHRSQKGEIDGNRSWLQSGHFHSLSREWLHEDAISGDDVFPGNNLGGDCRESVCELFVRAESLEKYK